MLRRVVGLYFSPSGQSAEVTRRITETIAAGLDAVSVESIEFECVDLLKNPLLKDISFDEETVVVFGMPVFNGRIPLPCVKLLKKLHGKDTMTVAVVSYGNSSYGDSLYELYTFAEEQGFKVVSAGAFVTRHALFGKIAENRPDDDDFVAIREFCNATSDKIKRLSGSLIQGLKVNPAPLDIKGCLPSKAPFKLPIHPTANSSCVKCGECAKICPTGAISIDDPTKVNVKKCISCTACMKVCEHDARGLWGPMAEASKLAMEIMYRKRKEPEWFL